VFPVPFIGQEAFEGHQQKCPEPAFLARRCLEVILLQQPRKEALREILGVMGARPCRRRNAYSGYQ